MFAVLSWVVSTTIFRPRKNTTFISFLEVLDLTVWEIKPAGSVFLIYKTVFLVVRLVGKSENVLSTGHGIADFVWVGGTEWDPCWAPVSPCTVLDLKWATDMTSLWVLPVFSSLSIKFEEKIINIFFLKGKRKPKRILAGFACPIGTFHCFWWAKYCPPVYLSQRKCLLTQSVFQLSLLYNALWSLQGKPSQP